MHFLWLPLWTQHVKYVIKRVTDSLCFPQHHILTLLLHCFPLSILLILSSPCLTSFSPSPNPSLCKSVTRSILQASVLQVDRRVYRSDRASQKWSGPWLQVPKPQPQHWKLDRWVIGPEHTHMIETFLSLSSCTWGLLAHNIKFRATYIIKFTWTKKIKHCGAVLWNFQTLFTFGLPHSNPYLI